MAAEAVPSTALPGKILGPVTRYASGLGTHIHQGNIVSSLMGHVSISQPSKPAGPVKRLNKLTAAASIPAELATISVTRHGRKREILPDVGNVVLTRVLRLMPKQAIVVIQQVGETVLQTEWQGVIRVQDVRATEKDKVKVHESFKPGDIVKAQVVRLAFRVVNPGYPLLTKVTDFSWRPGKLLPVHRVKRTWSHHGDKRGWKRYGANQLEGVQGS